MNILRKILAILKGEHSQLLIIAEKIVERLGSDIFTVSDDERRERIVSAVKSYMALRYPQFAAYEGIVIDFVVSRVREALRKKR